MKSEKTEGLGVKMKGKLLGILSFFTILTVLVCAAFIRRQEPADPSDAQAEQLVAVNEIRQMIRNGQTNETEEKCSQLAERIKSSETAGAQNGSVFILGGISLAFMLFSFGYIYLEILMPFDKLERYAQRIARGNFDLPLKYERSNYFGSFTWAFDSMRREITKARAAEREAIENNKTVIATLSHDIKTPVASIRAYAEGLEAGMDNTPEKRAKYLSVMMKKCDEVSRLTNDLFLHSLSDLDRLELHPERLELRGFLQQAVRELEAAHGVLHFELPDFTADILADSGRLLQIIENIVNNARKYAKSDIDVTLHREEHHVYVHIRDYGEGIPDEDMPFIFDKFYRGRNCKNEPGSGLGLYIVRYLTEKTGGSVQLCNHANGLEVILSFPVCA